MIGMLIKYEASTSALQIGRSLMLRSGGTLNCTLSVALNPSGIVLVNGLVGEVMFYTGALEKYGVGVQIVRVGKYKSYVEPFTRTNMSPENREQTSQLLTTVWDEILLAISQSRQLDPRQLQAWVDKAEGLKPQDALARKLVDKLAYFDEELAE